MTPQQAILSLGALTLSGCGAGLVLIHDTNPLLKGLNWAGTALVVGGAAAAFTLAATPFPALLPVAQGCILFAFLCANRADRSLLGHPTRLGRSSITLLALQSLLAVAFWLGLLHTPSMMAGSCVLAAVQIALTAVLVRKDAVGKMRLASLFTLGLLVLLCSAVLLRAVGFVTGLLTVSHLAESLNLLTYILLVAAAIGLAFTFFWRTTARLSMELEHMASTDPLTRVFNRRVFMNWCESEQQRSQRVHAPFSLLMLDFDHFKQVNDTYGHHVGDQVLCAAVERIQDSIRGIDVLCRWGGEEFAVLLPNASEEATLIVAERVRRNIRSLQAADFRFTDPVFAELQLSVSIGTATFEGEDDTYHLMLQRADTALYEAKRTGRNRVVRAARERISAPYNAAPLVANS